MSLGNSQRVPDKSQWSGEGQGDSSAIHGSPKSQLKLFVDSASYGDCRPSQQRLFKLLQLHGDFTLAYNIVTQKIVQYFGNAESLVGYGKRWGHAIALGDPLGPVESHRDLLKAFIEQKRRPSFCQLSEKSAEIVASLGYCVNEMGTDSILDLSSYDFKGKSKEWLRYASNWTSRRGYKVQEMTIEQAGGRAVEDLSDAWKQTRTVKRREVRFINRPMQYETEPGVRRFFLTDSEDKILAFIFFDPLFTGVTKVDRLKMALPSGYVACNKRRHPDAPVYGEQAIMKHAIETFQSEGVNELRLGLLPLVDVEDQKFRSSFIVHQLFKRTYRSKLINKYFYHVQGHSKYKRRFRGSEEKVYFATPNQLSGHRLVTFLSLCGIV